MRLACDAWLVPGGSTPGPTWRAALPKKTQWLAMPSDWGQPGAVRATVLADVDRHLAVPVLTDIVGHNRHSPAWYVAGARDFLRVAAAVLRARGRAPLFGRTRHLLALPLLGTAGGGGAFWSGEITALLLPLLRAEARALDVDVVLSLIEGPAWAAAQKARLNDPAAFSGLPQVLMDKADSLAERARCGGLTIFMGAGVSRPAGLPSWDELLHAIAVDRLPADQLTAFEQLSVLDRAALLQRRLPATLALGDEVADLMLERSTRYALGHALLASLPVDEVVTTNYDTLFEMASAVVGRPCARIPGQPVGRGERFILKMHGCVKQPRSIVLTREDYLRFQENRSALAGIVQALLLTRHMLFVGFGFTDDNFHRIAHAVREALRGERGAGSVAKQQPFGTNLVVGGGDLLADLWSDDLDWVTTAEHSASPADQARLVEIFLDRLSARSATVTSHLGDERYAGVLTDGEKMLRDRLLQMVAEVTVPEQQTLAFDEVRALLVRLGLASGSRHERTKQT